MVAVAVLEKRELAVGQLQHYTSGIVRRVHGRRLSAGTKWIRGRLRVAADSPVGGDTLDPQWRTTCGLSKRDRIAGLQASRPSARDLPVEFDQLWERRIVRKLRRNGPVIVVALQRDFPA